MALRERPRALDWVGVALRVAGVALRAHDEQRRARAFDPWRYFCQLGDTDWTEVPPEFRRLVLDHVTDVVIDEAYWDGDAKSPFLCRGKLDGEIVGWIGEGETVVDGPYVPTARLEATYRALGQRLWRRLGTSHAYFGAAGLVSDRLVDRGGVLATGQMHQLHGRMRGFLAAGQARSYLLAGPPGTGKSVAIRWLIDALELRSIRIDLGVLARVHGGHSPELVGSLETMLSVLQPRAMVLDDLDRITVTAPLLAFLELAQRICMVVVASANSTSAMMGALLRPGRFDEIVQVDRLDPAVLQTLLADDVDLCARFAELPAAYVVEFAKRRRVLGREQALAEVDELIERARRIGRSRDVDQA